MFKPKSFWPPKFECECVYHVHTHIQIFGGQKDFGWFNKFHENDENYVN